MNKQKQKGSIEVVIVSVVALAIVGAVGFIAWNNFTNRDQSESVPNVADIDQKKDDQRQYKTVQIDDSFPAKLSWKYPDNWTASVSGRGPTENETDSVRQAITITSPSKDYEVGSAVVINGGFGGTCMPEYAHTVHSIVREPVAGVPDALFVELITKGKSPTGEEQFGYVSGLYQDEESIRSVKPGDSRCKIGTVNTVTLSDETGLLLMGAGIRMNKVNPRQDDGSLKPITDIMAIKNAYDSDEYKDAVKILRSAKLGD